MSSSGDQATLDAVAAARARNETMAAELTEGLDQLRRLQERMGLTPEIRDTLLAAHANDPEFIAQIAAMQAEMAQGAEPPAEAAPSIRVSPGRTLV